MSYDYDYDYEYDYELNRHKSSDTVKWVLTLIAFILVGVMFAGIFCGWFERKEEQPAEEEQTEQAAVVDENGNAMNEDTIYPMPAKMSFSAAALVEAQAVASTASTIAERSIEVQIEAYVTPENATNREVDFSVAWGDGAQRSAEPVTNYVTVTPQSDGSRIATVACSQGFGNDTILITVTTRDGGFQATCTVTFEGAPSSLKFVYNNTTYSIAGDTLIVNAIRSETSFSYPTVPPRTGTRVTYDSAYYDPRGGGVPSDCRARVLVEDTVSGVEALIYIDIEGTAVSGVSLSQTQMDF